MADEQKARKRLMKTSTFDALAMSEDKPVEEWSPEVLDAVLEDTAEVERRRWIERASWIVLALTTAGFGYLGGLEMHERDEPELVTCDVKVAPEAALVDPIILRCVGEEGEFIE